jgi:hypothetical protein
MTSFELWTFADRMLLPFCYAGPMKSHFLGAFLWLGYALTFFNPETQQVNSYFSMVCCNGLKLNKAKQDNTKI